MATVGQWLTAQEMKKYKVPTKVKTLSVTVLKSLGKAFAAHRKKNPRQTCCCTP